MSPTRTAAPGRLLTQVAGERQTGALVVDGHPGGSPGGAVYLHDGAVVYAESPAAPGVGELLTASGRLAGRTWQAALDAGTAGARVGRLLLDQGHLTQGELELCVLGAIYDAAYFALAPASAPVEFRAGAGHWLGTVVRVEAAAVNREARRRARLLDEIYPHGKVDAAPVIPVPRAPRERVTLTALQWELLVHADGQRTPADLAQLLGRAGYATIQELRRLAALGLIERPVQTDKTEGVRLPRARGSAPATPATRPVVTLDDPPLSPAVVTRQRTATAIEEPPYTGDPVTNGTVYRPPRLARRKPGAKLPKDLAGEPPPEPAGADEVLLKRIRTALRALR
ncbi:MarR family transcriptional regulator [Actinoplanes sp. NPDC049265]|uniref:MarR family transcriptional regulator n=1 Tax=Actinoplanes sp. NPDC049265 TaxID=3363902 RepID=UPI00371A6F55